MNEHYRVGAIRSKINETFVVFRKVYSDLYTKRAKSKYLFKLSVYMSLNLDLSKLNTGMYFLI